MRCPAPTHHAIVKLNRGCGAHSALALRAHLQYFERRTRVRDIYKHEVGRGSKTADGRNHHSHSGGLFAARI